MSKKKFDLEAARAAIPERCGERDCMCSGGKHALCKTAFRKNDADKEFLLSLGRKE